MEEPGGLLTIGSHRVAHDWSGLACMHAIGEGNGNTLQYPCLENPRHGRAWWAAVYGVPQSWTWLKRLSSSSSSSIGMVYRFIWKPRHSFIYVWPETLMEREEDSFSYFLNSFFFPITTSWFIKAQHSVQQKALTVVSSQPNFSIS